MYSALSPLTKYLKPKGVKIYDCIFLIHSKFTVLFLFTCLIILSAKQYFGDPMICMGDENSNNKDYVNTFCWTMGTYVMSDCKERISIIYPGTRNIIAEGVCPEGRNNGEKVYLRYYQWVVVILLIQALAFYFPCYLWKIWEGDRLNQICSGISTRNPIVADNTYSERLQMLIKYFSSDYKDIHSCYALKYIFCEFLNLFINIINIFLLNVFFDGFWSKYISAISTIPAYNWTEWNKLSSRVFPKVAKCDFLKYGASQTIETRDMLCILPLNIFNEKIFAFLWCWFLLLAFLSFFNVIYRAFLILNSNIRIHLIRTQVQFMSVSQVRTALDGMHVGDWFFLLKVSTNLNPILFRDLMQALFDLRKSGRKLANGI